MFLLIDGSSYMHRSFHQHKHLTRPRDGHPVGAVFGFIQHMSEIRYGYVHTHAAVVFDGNGGSRRRIAAHPGYKAHRNEKPSALLAQYDLVRAAARAVGFPVVEVEGEEADDVVATYVRRASAAGLDVTLFTNDKDYLQLLRPGVRFFDWMKGRYVNEADCLKKFGVAPHLVPHVQALWGDAIDGIPGVDGVGTVYGRDVINRWGGLEEALVGLATNADQCGCSPRIRSAILENAASARLSLRLAKLFDDVEPLPEIETLAAANEDRDALLAFIEDMQFVSLKRRWFGEAAA